MGTNLHAVDKLLTMVELNPWSMLNMSTASQEALVTGARDCQPVRGLTHGFYKYPARFSPSFVRAAIEAFTVPGDLVLDNHVGGGTTLVEALALGRNSIGVDVSTLAEFVSTVKTTVLDEAELIVLENWVYGLSSAIHLHKSSIYFSEYAERGYYKHIGSVSHWRLRKAIEQSLGSAIGLGSERLQSFGRCVVLRTAQWALDGRKALPSIDEFRSMLTRYGKEMVEGARQLRDAVSRNPNEATAKILNRSAFGLEEDRFFAEKRSPNLVLTSPPYPGIHVLYHRWQVDGRKEAPLPFMIANKLDGAGSSYYTMGDRRHPELKTYFDSIRASMSSIAAIADENTTIVQMVAFSDPTWQLPRYLETMEEAGLEETFLPLLQHERDGRLWRRVPGRRWYSGQRGETPGSQEVVLIHRRRESVPGQSCRHYCQGHPTVLSATQELEIQGH